MGTANPGAAVETAPGQVGNTPVSVVSASQPAAVAVAAQGGGSGVGTGVVAGQVFQFGTTPALGAVTATAALAQRPADQVFQALARAAVEAGTPESLADVYAWALASRREQPGPAAASLDRVFGGSATAALDWLSGLDPYAAAAAGRREPAGALLGAPTGWQALREGAALEDSFSGMTDCTDGAADVLAGE